jgi:hypothetical protein
MPLKPGVPTQSHEALETWFRQQINTPEMFAKLQNDFAGTVEALIGIPPPPWLKLNLVVQQPGQQVQVQKFAGGHVGADGVPVAAAHVNANSKMAVDSNAPAPLILKDSAKERFLVFTPESIGQAPAKKP